MKKLAIVISHPIQYYAPVFKLLAKKVQLKVFYTWGKESINKYDHGFGQQIEWDVPLLCGYNSVFLENTSKDAGTHRFNGIINPRLITVIQDFTPDAILIYGWAWKSHLKVLRFFKGKTPIYFRGDSTLLDEQKSFKRLLRFFLLKWVYSHVDKAFYVGASNKDYFKAYGLKEEQLLFAPHAIDNERFSEENISESEQLRVQFGIKSDEILVLFAGKLEPKKNPELLLDAFINLNLKNTHLLFVGNGVLEESLKRKADGLEAKMTRERAFHYSQNSVHSPDIIKRIHFMDFQNQSRMPIVYQACDLFCLPSKGPGETWGLAVNEAMAAVKAVLASNKAGCTIDLVKPNINGNIFNSGDLGDLKEKLEVLTKNKGKLAQMGLASQQIIKDWSFEKQVKVIVDTIQSEHAK